MIDILLNEYGSNSQGAPPVPFNSKTSKNLNKNGIQIIFIFRYLPGTRWYRDKQMNIELLAYKRNTDS